MKPTPRCWILHCASALVIGFVIWVLKEGDRDYPLWLLVLGGAILWAFIGCIVEVIVQGDRIFCWAGWHYQGRALSSRRIGSWAGDPPFELEVNYYCPECGRKWTVTELTFHQAGGLQ